MTDYLATVIGHRCGTKRTFTVSSAWIDVVVAAAVATKLKPTTQDTQYATVMVASREAPDAPWEQVRYELGTTVDYPLPLPSSKLPPVKAPPTSPLQPDPYAAIGVDSPVNTSLDPVGVVFSTACGKVASYTWEYIEVQEPDPQPGHYYVTAQDGDRSWHVCGPWPTHAEALAALAVEPAMAGILDPAVWSAVAGSAGEDR